MLAPLTKKMADHSTETEFAFSFFCDICGREWRSESFPFSGGESGRTLAEKVGQLIWQCEHNAAYERANHEAMLEHNHCPICGKWVCQDCFYLRSHAITDLCVECLPHNE